MAGSATNSGFMPASAVAELRLYTTIAVVT
jgi:hypothetical protein